MKKWLAFLFAPLLTIWVMDFISAFIVAGIFQQDRGSFIGCAVLFAIHFVGGTMLYQLAPSIRKLPLAMLGAFLYTAASIYLGITTHGLEGEFMGEKGVHQFRFWVELSQAAGIFLGVYGLHASEKEEQARLQHKG
ncbi:hypothetical protein MHM84_20555 [Halomonas sp. McH1-25]|uniref:hypothetical protein n=1 Tax=unclassified Halomonas TaxID=2609666 RepID=UPI001EF47211|nr:MULTISPECIES: hypothetical protein [unclassified Halomonas]MCG7602131.1 hypothetical protein [Halomonas sp. McH1-25]MCP1344412.1 hypothetical protein [Halomonas sp. FL8]MCP1362498.1 hypothetical protein [Halomonas sp. BBD45]MCP1364555.1 hypothetical protein [Halomonas sp. BBD48]